MFVAIYTMSASAERKIGAGAQNPWKRQDFLDLRIPSATVNGNWDLI